MQQSPEITALILEWYRRIAMGDMLAAAEDMLTGESGLSCHSQTWAAADRCALH